MGDITTRVDAGAPGRGAAIQRELDEAGIRIDRIGFTHGASRPAERAAPDSCRCRREGRPWTTGRHLGAAIAVPASHQQAHAAGGQDRDAGHVANPAPLR